MSSLIRYAVPAYRPGGFAPLRSQTVGPLASPSLPSLPGQIAGISPETQGYLGPYKDGNGNLYTVTESDLASSNQPRIMKSTDGGKTWTEQNAAGRPTGTGDLEGAWLAQESTALYLLYQDSQGDVKYATFNTSDAGSTPDTWTLYEADIFTDTVTSNQGACVVPLTNGDVWGFWHADAGARYAKRSGGVWGAASTITGSGAARGVVAVRGASNLTHIFYNDASNNIQHRSLSSTGTLSSAEQVNDTAGHTVAKNLSNPVYYDDGGAETITVAWLNSTNAPRAARVINDGTPAAEETISATAVLANPGFGNVAAIISLAKDTATLDVYAVWADSSTKDLWYNKSTDGGAWTSDVELADGVTTDWIHGANVFTHSAPNGGKKVLGWVAEDNTDNNELTDDIQYNELEFAAGDATVTPEPIALSAAIPQTAVSVGAAPAVVDRAVVTPQAAGGVGATPAVIPTTVIVPQLAVDVGASPAVLAVAAAIPAAVVSVGAAPAVIPLAIVIPQATPDTGSGNATALPDVIARAFTVPQLAVSIGAAPAVIVQAVTTPQAAVSVGALQTVIAQAFAIPQLAVSVGVAPAVIALAFTIPQATPDTGGTPATVQPDVIARAFALPQASVSVGVLATVIVRAFTIPQATPAISFTVTPAVIARAFAMDTATINVGASPATIALAFTLPVAFLPGQLRVLVGVDAASSAVLVGAETIVVGQPS